MLTVRQTRRLSHHPTQPRLARAAAVPARRKMWGNETRERHRTFVAGQVARSSTAYPTTFEAIVPFIHHLLYLTKSNIHLTLDMSAIKAASAPGGSVAANTLLSRYLAALNANPLRTKMYTSGVLAALAEILAGHFAGLPPPTEKSLPPTQVNNVSAFTQQPFRFIKNILATLGINDRAIKMFIYGAAVSAPLGHVMTGALQRAFAGKTTPKDKIAQIVTSSLTVTVVANVVYLASMAVVNGARSVDKIVAVVKAGIWRMLQISWLTSPAALAFAQNYLEPQLWGEWDNIAICYFAPHLFSQLTTLLLTTTEPFFTLLRFFLSTYFNTMAKKKQVALARKEALKKGAQSQAEKDAGDAEIRRLAQQGK